MLVAGGEGKSERKRKLASSDEERIEIEIRKYGEKLKDPKSCEK